MHILVVYKILLNVNQYILNQNKYLPHFKYPSKTLQQTEGHFQKHMLSMTLLLGELEEMMISRRKRKCSLINVAFAANAKVCLDKALSFEL